MLEIWDLKCENQKNPVGIEKTKPRFSWKSKSDKTEIVQQAFFFQLAEDHYFTTLLWESGKVNSEKSAWVELDMIPLQSLKKYYWRVKIQDNKGQESDWSQGDFFVLLGLEDLDWKAKFISPEPIIPEGAKDTATSLETVSQSSKAFYLRKAFQITSSIASAYLVTSALGVYEFYINGVSIGNEVLKPGWTNYKSRLLLQTFDITKTLVPGENIAGAIVGVGWYKGDLAGWMGRRNVYGQQVALVGQLVICYTDGSQQIIPTQEDWKCYSSPILYSELYHGETYDARKAQKDWQTTQYNDSQWWSPQIVEQDLSVLCPQDGVAIRAQESISAQSLLITPKGERVLDFGQNLAGWVEFRVKGKAGQKVVLKHGEVLDKEGNFYDENMRGAKCKIEYILSGEGEEIYAPHFSFQGFRYVLVEAYPEEVEKENFTAIVVHSDFTATGSFSCSNPLLNQLHHNINWGLKGNFLDIPTDCPQRDERLGWTGDAQVFISTASYLQDVHVFFRKWLRDLASEQLQDGGIPFVIPDVLTGISQTDDKIDFDHSSSGWADAVTICPWEIWLAYGDKRILQDQYPSMVKWIQYVYEHSENGLLWNKGFHFGDWVALDAKEGSYFGATPVDLISTAYYAGSTLITSKVARILGKDEQADYYLDLWEKIKKAYQAEFFTSTGRLVSMTQTAHILSLYFHLVKPQDKERTVKTLLDLLQNNQGHLETGFLGTPYFCQVLSDNGAWKEAFDLLLKEDFPSWLYQIKMGATTIWEHWDGIKPDGSMWSADMNSFNHYAYGSVGNWIYKNIGGIQIDENKVGYKQVIIAPKIGGGITWAKACLNTMYGMVKVDWKMEATNIRMEVEIPANTKGVIVFPWNQESKEVGSGRWSFGSESSN